MGFSATSSIDTLSQSIVPLLRMRYIGGTGTLTKIQKIKKNFAGQFNTGPEMAGRKIGVQFGGPTVLRNIPLVGMKISSPSRSIGDEGGVQKFRLVLPHASLVSFCTVYMLFGAWIFILLERPTEIELRKAAQKDFADDQKRFEKLMDHNFSSVEKMNEAINEYLDDSARMRFYWWENNYSEKKQWTYGNSVFFCVSMLTTIGYGTITPVTTAGRIVCMLYGGLGVPLMLITVTDIGMFLSEALRNAITLCRVYLNREESLPYAAITTFLMLYLCVGTSLMSICGGGHTLIDSFYWAFITMTSIGFGDIVPEGGWQMSFLALYMVVGISITSMCIEQSFAFYIHKLHYVGRKILNVSTITDMVNYARILRRRQGLIAEKIDDSVLKHLRNMSQEVENGNKRGERRCRRDTDEDSVRDETQDVPGAFDPLEGSRFHYIDQSRGISVASTVPTRKYTVYTETIKHL